MRMRIPPGRCFSCMTPSRGLDSELLCVLGAQSLPAAEFHRLRTRNASNRLTRQQPVQHVEADVPARGAPRDEAAIDTMPKLETRAAAQRLQLPPEVAATPAVLQQPRSFRPLHRSLGDLRRRSPGG